MGSSDSYSRSSTNNNSSASSGALAAQRRLSGLASCTAPPPSSAKPYLADRAVAATCSSRSSKKADIMMYLAGHQGTVGRMLNQSSDNNDTTRASDPARISSDTISIMGASRSSAAAAACPARASVLGGASAGQASITSAGRHSIMSVGASPGQSLRPPGSYVSAYISDSPILLPPANDSAFAAPAASAAASARRASLTAYLQGQQGLGDTITQGMPYVGSDYAAEQSVGLGYAGALGPAEAAGGAAAGAAGVNSRHYAVKAALNARISTAAACNVPPRFHDEASTLRQSILTEGRARRATTAAVQPAVPQADTAAATGPAHLACGCIDIGRASCSSSGPGQGRSSCQFYPTGVSDWPITNTSSCCCIYEESELANGESYAGHARVGMGFSSTANAAAAAQQDVSPWRQLAAHDSNAAAAGGTNGSSSGSSEEGSDGEWEEDSSESEDGGAVFTNSRVRGWKQRPSQMRQGLATAASADRPGGGGSVMGRRPSMGVVAAVNRLSAIRHPSGSGVLQQGTSNTNRVSLRRSSSSSTNGRTVFRPSGSSSGGHRNTIRQRGSRDTQSLPAHRSAAAAGSSSTTTTSSSSGSSGSSRKSSSDDSGMARGASGRVQARRASAAAVAAAAAAQARRRTSLQGPGSSADGRLSAGRAARASTRTALRALPPFKKASSAAAAAGTACGSIQGLLHKRAARQRRSLAQSKLLSLRKGSARGSSGSDGSGSSSRRGSSSDSSGGGRVVLPRRSVRRGSLVASHPRNSSSREAAAAAARQRAASGRASVYTAGSGFRLSTSSTGGACANPVAAVYRLSHPSADGWSNVSVAGSSSSSSSGGGCGGHRGSSGGGSSVSAASEARRSLNGALEVMLNPADKPRCRLSLTEHDAQAVLLGWLSGGGCVGSNGSSGSSGGGWGAGEAGQETELLEELQERYARRRRQSSRAGDAPAAATGAEGRQGRASFMQRRRARQLKRSGSSISSSAGGGGGGSSGNGARMAAAAACARRSIARMASQEGEPAAAAATAAAGRGGVGSCGAVRSSIRASVFGVRDRASSHVQQPAGRKTWVHVYDDAVAAAANTGT